MKNKYVFILCLTFVCSLLLSLFSEGLKSKIIFNKTLDKKKNILETVGVDTGIMSNDQILNSFKKNISESVIDLKGNEFNDIYHDKLTLIENNKTGEVKYYYNNIEYLPFYISYPMNALILPVSGKGLWSSLFGYFALDLENYSTVKGITFYEHGETPGLGAEITKDWFKSSFIGKEIFLNNELKSINVAKAGKADKNNKYEVDGISGATITGRGVEILLRRDLLRYKPYLRKNK